MSREDGKRQQAQNLLRALTDIDDRFLEEAIRDDQDLDAAIGKDQNLEAAIVYDPDKVQVKLPEAQAEQNGRQESSSPEIGSPEIGSPEIGSPEIGSPEIGSPEDGKPEIGRSESTQARKTDISKGIEKKQPGKLRRYSSWALTAAACLTVVLVGRYVSVNHVTTDVKSTAIESEQKPEIAQAVSEVQSTGEAAKNVLQTQSTDEAAKNALQFQSTDEAAKNAPQDQLTDEAVIDVSGEDPEYRLADEAAGNILQAQSAGEAEEDFAKSDSSEELADPFVEVQTVEEAEKTAGFEIFLPGEKAPYDTVVYRAIPGEMIEVIYLDDDGTEGYRIRSAADTKDDISGDSTVYAKEEVLKATDGTLVQVKGDADQKWSLACWSGQGKDKTQYSFAVIAGKKTFSSEEVLDIVSLMNGIDQ